MAKFRITLIFLILLVSLVSIAIAPVWANTDTSGSAASTVGNSAAYVYAVPVTVTVAGSVQSIGINWAGTPAGGNVEVALYSAGSGKPASLLTSSSSVTVATGAGWQDIPVAGYSVVAGSYWLAFAISQNENAGVFYYSGGSRSYYVKSYGSFDATWSSSSGQDGYNYNLRITYSTGPPPSDFTITAPTSSQSVGAGATASYSLNIQYSSTLTATVNLAVTFGCPTGVTCTVTPNQVTGTTNGITLSVPTLVTTPGGTTSVNVTASSTSPSLSHTVTVQLTVTAPSTFPVTVQAGATQVIVTVSWAGSGATPVTLAGPNGTPIISETSPWAVVYNRISNPTVVSAPTLLHRVTFTLSPSPSSPQTWTVYVSLSLPGSYTVTVEVS